RDIMIVGAVILSWLIDKPMRLKPLNVSKLNTVAQIVYATLVLAALSFQWDIPLVLNSLMALVAVLTLLSVAFYVAQWVRHMNVMDWLGPTLHCGSIPRARSTRAGSKAERTMAVRSVPRQLAFILGHAESFAREDFLSGSSNAAVLALIESWPE